MADSSLTGSFSPGFFIPHWDLADIDSGLPEWTLGEDGTPPAEPTEEDAEDEDDDDSEDSEDKHSGDENYDDGYDADDEDDGDCGFVVNDDDDDYDEDYAYFLSTLPAGYSPMLDDPVEEEEEEEETSSSDYDDYDDDSASLPLLETDSGTWALESDAAYTEAESLDESLDAAIRSTSPDFDEIFNGLTLNGQFLSPDLDIHTDSVNLPGPDAEQPPLWDSARPIEAFWVEEVMRFMEIEDMRR
jgi:hypothetical protein